jgi:hypothetical protein
MGTRVDFSGGKAAGEWSWPLISIQCRGQEWWNYTSAMLNYWSTGTLMCSGYWLSPLINVGIVECL